MCLFLIYRLTHSIVYSTSISLYWRYMLSDIVVPDALTLLELLINNYLVVIISLYF